MRPLPIQHPDCCLVRPWCRGLSQAGHNPWHTETDRVNVMKSQGFQLLVLWEYCCTSIDNSYSSIIKSSNHKDTWKFFQLAMVRCKEKKILDNKLFWCSVGFRKNFFIKYIRKPSHREMEWWGQVQGGKAMHTSSHRSARNWNVPEDTHPQDGDGTPSPNSLFSARWQLEYFKKQQRAR